MLVSGRVNACRIEFSHTQLCPSVPNKSNSHRTKLHSALVDAFAQSAYPEKNSQILANWESLGWFHAISLSTWTSIAKFHILITEVPPSNETSLLTAACQRLSYFFQGLLRKPKQHQVKRNQEQHCDKNEDTYFHLYVHAKYTIQISTMHTSILNTLHFTWFLVISPLYPISLALANHTGTLQTLKVPTGVFTFRCLKRSRISKGICRRTSCFAVAPRSKGQLVTWVVHAHVLRKVYLQIQILAVLDSLSNSRFGVLGYLSSTGMLQNPPFLSKQDALKLFKSAICQSFRSVSFWMVLVKGNALNQSIILGVRCILLHFALVIEDGLFLRNKGINSIDMYHSSIKEQQKGLATTWKELLHMFLEDITLGKSTIAWAPKESIDNFQVYISICSVALKRKIKPCDLGLSVGRLQQCLSSKRIFESVKIKEPCLNAWGLWTAHFLAVPSRSAKGPKFGGSFQVTEGWYDSTGTHGLFHIWSAQEVSIDKP